MLMKEIICIISLSVALISLANSTEEPVTGMENAEKIRQLINVYPENFTTSGHIYSLFLCLGFTVRRPDNMDDKVGKYRIEDIPNVYQNATLLIEDNETGDVARFPYPCIVRGGSIHTER